MTSRLFPRDIHAEATLLIRVALEGKERDNYSTLGQLAANIEHCMTVYDVPLHLVLFWINRPKQKLTLAAFRAWAEEYVAQVARSHNDQQAVSQYR